MYNGILEEGGFEPRNPPSPEYGHGSYKLKGHNRTWARVGFERSYVCIQN